MGATTTIMHLVAPGDRDRRGERRLRRDVPPVRQGLRPEGLRLRVRRRGPVGRGDRRADAARLARDADEPAAEHRRHRARSPRLPMRPVRLSQSTTPSRRRTSSARSSSGPTSSTTRRRSTSAGTPTSSAGSRRRTTRRSRNGSRSCRTRSARCRGRSTRGSCCAG